MKAYIKIIFFHFLIIQSCVSTISQYQGDIPCLEIDVDISSSDHLTPDDIIEKKIVLLETSRNSVFGNITKLFITKDRIFILDSENAEGLFVFDMNGRFLFKIAQKGRGPGEYYSINDFFVDSISQNISIYDANNRNLHYYDWNGKYIRSHSFSKFWSFACCPIDSVTYALDFTKRAMRLNKYHLLLADSKNNVFFRYKPLEIDYGLANNFHISFYQSYGKNYYVATACDTIFEISSNGIERGIRVNFGKNKLPNDFLKKIPYSKHATNLLSSKYCYGIKNVSETSNMLSFQYLYGNRGLSAFWDKRTQKSYHGSYYPPPMASYKDYLVGYLEAYTIKEIVKSAHRDENFLNEWKIAMGKEIWSSFENVKENDNPLLFFYKIK